MGIETRVRTARRLHPRSFAPRLASYLLPQAAPSRRRIIAGSSRRPAFGLDVDERKNTGIIGLQHGVAHTDMLPQRCSILREVAPARSHESCSITEARSSTPNTVLTIARTAN